MRGKSIGRVPEGQPYQRGAIGEPPVDADVYMYIVDADEDV